MPNHGSKFDGIEVIFCSKSGEEGFSLFNGGEDWDLDLDRFLRLRTSIRSTFLDHSTSDLEGLRFIMCPLHHDEIRVFVSLSFGLFVRFLEVPADLVLSPRWTARSVSVRLAE